MVRQVHIGGYTELHPRGGGGGAASFLENSTRKQRQERGSRGRKLHPLSERNTVAVATPTGCREHWGSEFMFPLLGLERLKIGILSMTHRGFTWSEAAVQIH